jgi:hypothetical protein
MNQSSTDQSLRPRAIEVFQDVLRREPDNPYGHFCLGIMAVDNQDPQEALGHFEAVLRKDSDDAASWYWLGMATPADSPRKAECFRKALKLEPAMAQAIYGLAGTLTRADQTQERQDLMSQFQVFQRAGTGTLIGVKYTEMGHYADVIGRAPDPNPPRVGPLPLFQPRKVKVQFAPGVRWATAADLGDDPVGKVRAKVRARFGATIVVLDFDGDGKPDLFLAGAVVEQGKVRDLLLHNDGDDLFVDVTAKAGLAKPHPTLGCCVADWDNDGKPDLLLTGAGSQRLYRNKGDGSFEDVTAKAGLDKLTSVCLGAAFIDLEQDADLDILIAEYAPTPEDALKALEGGKASGSLVVFLNTGESPAENPNKQPPPLSGKFTRAKGEDLAALRGGPAPVTGIAAADLDGDNDVDLLAFADGTAPAVVVNDRLLRFRRQALPGGVAPATAWNGALVLDADHNGRSDLFMVPSGQPPRLLLNRSAPGENDPGKWLEAGPTNAPPLLQAVLADVDLDGWADVVGLSAERLPVLLHNEGGKLVLKRDAFGLADGWPKDLVALTTLDVNGDGFPDLLTWSETKGPQLYESRGNGNHAVRLQLSGGNHADGNNNLRCNMDGIGTWVTAQKEGFWTGQENVTLAAGLGQSRQPLTLGLGAFPTPDVVRLRWPDGCWQAQLDVHAGRLTLIEEHNLKPGSCPVLFAWDGRRFAFVTDFLGAGSVGELGPDGTCRPPRPEESVKIEPHQLAPRDGAFVLKIAEPMSEVAYLDRLQLVAIDHPAGTHVYPDERFATAGPPPSQELIAFDKEVFPVAARDHRGRDVTEALRHWDRVTADGFARRAWTGFAEDHFVELDFGDRLAGFKSTDRLTLCLAGWTDYAYPESIWAAHQAGVEMRPPVLERLGEDGRWRSLGEAGLPAGLPRMMTRDVTGQLAGPRCRLRLRTNLHVFWDQAFVAAGCRTVTPGAKDGVRAVVLDVQGAELEPCGVMQEYSPDGRQPTVFDHDRHEQVPLSPPAGKRTRFGDVTELLRQRDDRFVVFGPGDEVTVRFDATRLPPLPAGWRRSFVLRTWGYCKDSGPFTATGATIEPLPFAAMRNYPPGPDEHYPPDAAHQDYLRRYQTREVGTQAAPARARR